MHNTYILHLYRDSEKIITLFPFKISAVPPTPIKKLVQNFTCTLSAAETIASKHQLTTGMTKTINHSGEVCERTQGIDHTDTLNSHQKEQKLSQFPSFLVNLCRNKQESIAINEVLQTKRRNLHILQIKLHSQHLHTIPVAI